MGLGAIGWARLGDVWTSPAIQWTGYFVSFQFDDGSVYEPRVKVKFTTSGGKLHYQMIVEGFFESPTIAIDETRNYDLFLSSFQIILWNAEGGAHIVSMLNLPIFLIERRTTFASFLAGPAHDLFTQGGMENSFVGSVRPDKTALFRSQSGGIGRPILVGQGSDNIFLITGDPKFKSPAYVGWGNDPAGEMYLKGFLWDVLNLYNQTLNLNEPKVFDYKRYYPFARLFNNLWMFEYELLAVEAGSGGCI